MDTPIKLFTHGGETWATGLGRMHAQEGFPLELSLDQCSIRGWRPCFVSTELELIKCGVDAGKAGGIISSALSNMIETVPECWRAGLNLRYF